MDRPDEQWESERPSPSGEGQGPQLRDPERDVERLLDETLQAIETIDGEAVEETPWRPFPLPDLTAPVAPDSSVADEATAKEATVEDDDLELRIELGRAILSDSQAQLLDEGDVVPLDRDLNQPVDVYADGRLVARGEVLIMNDVVCIRVTEVIDTENS